MPAYRSSDEADIRTDVVARIRECWPSARVIHEINCAGTGSNRIDVLAVTELSIAAFEIKSKKDKLDRLPDQYRAMTAVAHVAFAAIHEKFLVEREVNAWSAWRTDENGRHWFQTVPPILEKDFRGRRSLWVWPRRQRSPEGRYPDDFCRWDMGPVRNGTALPHGALGMLWADELRAMCADLRIGVGPRATMSDCVTQIRWLASGEEVTRGICKALRRRDCVEADPPVTEVSNG